MSQCLLLLLEFGLVELLLGKQLVLKSNDVRLQVKKFPLVVCHTFAHALGGVADALLVS